jgi:hypothetical protein
MTTTFAEFASTADARKQQQEIVMKWTQGMCEALLKDFQRYTIEHHTLAMLMCDKDEEFTIKYHQKSIEEAERGENLHKFYHETGRKYHKIMMECEDGSRSVHAFVDKKTGEVYKSSGQKPDLNGVRYDMRLITERENLYKHCDWSGGYLYMEESTRIRNYPQVDG